jgi:hypothetical protein
MPATGPPEQEPALLRVGQRADRARSGTPGRAFDAGSRPPGGAFDGR